MERLRSTDLKTVITSYLEKIDSVYCELVEKLHITEQTAHLMITAVNKLINKGEEDMKTDDSVESLQSKLYEDPRASCMTATMGEINEQMPFLSSRNGPAESQILLSRQSFQSNQMSHLRDQTFCGDDSLVDADKISDDINTNEELIGDDLLGDEFLVDLQQQQEVVLDSVDDYNACNMENHMGDELVVQDCQALKRFESNENT